MALGKQAKTLMKAQVDAALGYRPSIHAPGCGKISTKSAFIKFPIGNSDGYHIDINRVQKMMPEKIKFGGRAHSQKIMGPFQQVFESL